jgi:hypothetical protein
MLPVAVPSIMIGNVSVLATPFEAAARANSCHDVSSTGSAQKLTTRSSSTASTQGPPARYWTASSTAMSRSDATRVKVTPRWWLARLNPMQSGTSSQVRRLRSVSWARRSSWAGEGSSSSIASRVSRMGSIASGTAVRRRSPARWSAP